MSYFDDNFHRLSGTDWFDAGPGENLETMRSAQRSEAARKAAAEQPVCPRCGGPTSTTYTIGTWDAASHPCWSCCGGVADPLKIACNLYGTG